MTLTLTQTARQRLADILAYPQGRRIGVLGLGIAGSAMAIHLARRGAHVLGFDKRTDLESAALQDAGVRLRLGEIKQQSVADLEALAISPGADPRQPAVQYLLAAERPVFGELELASKDQTPVVAITGTNGKSTTTALIGALLKSCGRRPFVGGNLGAPIAAWLDAKDKSDVAVLELSSFQLETAYSFAPHVGVLLNITPDHLDRYASFEAYALAKERLVTCVAPYGTVVLNADDKRVSEMASKARGRVLWFSTTQDKLPGDGLTLQGTSFAGHGALQTFGRIELHHPRLAGRHNRENTLAAFLAAYGLGAAAQADALAAGYRAFTGLADRLEPAGVIDHVQYINDSKATNDASAATGLQAMTQPVVLLLGGKDKGGGYAQTVAAARERKVRCIVAFGAAAPQIEAAFQDQAIDLKVCENLLAACAMARAIAQPHDVVLLSPACASFDEFTDYKQRGRVFKEWVENRRSSGGKQ